MSTFKFSALLLLAMLVIFNMVAVHSCRNATQTVKSSVSQLQTFASRDVINALDIQKRANQIFDFIQRNNISKDDYVKTVSKNLQALLEALKSEQDKIKEKLKNLNEKV